MPRPLPHYHKEKSPTFIPASVTEPNGAVSSSLERVKQENIRLKAELDRLRQTNPSPAMNSRAVMWMACSLCGVALLFALAVLFRR
jgi:hypothetical protein